MARTKNPKKTAAPKGRPVVWQAPPRPCTDIVSRASSTAHTNPAFTLTTAAALLKLAAPAYADRNGGNPWKEFEGQIEALVRAETNLLAQEGLDQEKRDAYRVLDLDIVFNGQFIRKFAAKAVFTFASPSSDGLYGYIVGDLVRAGFPYMAFVIKRARRVEARALARELSAA